MCVCVFSFERVCMRPLNFLLAFKCFRYLPDDFPESTGVKRIVQALNANVWTSVQMKDGEVTSHWNSCLDFESCSFHVGDVGFLVYLSGLNQGFGLMTSLVASRHNNPHSYTPQEALVSAGSHSQTNHSIIFIVGILHLFILYLSPCSLPARQ